jgi:hypothetical protein
MTGRKGHGLYSFKGQGGRDRVFNYSNEREEWTESSFIYGREEGTGPLFI